MTYVELHNHSYYSLLDGHNSPLEIVQTAKELGHGAVCVTDHGTMSAHRHLQQACSDEGLTPVLGVEAYISSTNRFDRRAVSKREDNTGLYNHVIIIAKDQSGLSNLQRMSERAWDEGFYYKPRVDAELLEEYREGLIVLSGCMNGVISKSLQASLQEITKSVYDANLSEMDDKDAKSFLRAVEDKLPTELRERFKDHLGTGEGYSKADEWTDWFVKTFDDDFYMEIQPHNPGWLNDGLMNLARKHSVRPVVTNDCHFTKASEREAEEIMLVLSTKPKRKKDVSYKDTSGDLFQRLEQLYEERPISFEHLDLYLKTEEQIAAELDAVGFNFGESATMIGSTLEIVSKVGEYEFYKGMDLLPTFGVGSDKAELRRIVFEGLESKGIATADYIERAEHELDTIEQLKFSRYFLIVADVIDYARRNGILVGPGRGSAAGSLVCYSTGITSVDPIEYGLLFSRFLDVDRGDWPDIDMDFADDRRGEVIEYMRQKYGFVANISTYETFKDKGVIKAVARALGVPYKEVEVMAKTFHSFEEYEVLARSGAQPNSAVSKFHRKYPLVLEFATKLRGKISNVGMHPAGVVVANEPIEKFASVEYRKDTGTNERIPAIVEDMSGAEDIGLIKFDFLGLKELKIIDKAMRLAGLTESDLPHTADELADKRVLQEFVKGNTTGIFQVKQAASTKLLERMRGVEFTFNDLVASNALVRPGAMNTIGDSFLRRRAGEEAITYDHELFEPFTKDTYGLPTLYQEQIMLAAQTVGGFSVTESNKLRKIIGKKLSVEEFRPWENQWMENAPGYLGVDRARGLWKDFQAAAEYSFNKSHSVAYSKISYWTMWLKVYYPLEFLTAALDAEEKTSNNPGWTKLLLEAKRLDVGLLLPDINKSEAGPSKYNGSILLGLGNPKFISDKTAQPIIAGRPYNSYADLQELSDTKNSGISKRVVSSLNRVGATAGLPGAPQEPVRDYMYEYLGIPAFSGEELLHPSRATDIAEYTEEGTFVIQGIVSSIKRGKGWARLDLLDETGVGSAFHDEQTELVEGGYYTMLVSNNTIIDWSKDDEGVFDRWLRADKLPGWLCVAVKERTTKAGKLMATAVWSDPGFVLHGALIFPGQYAKLGKRIRAGTLSKPFIGELDDGGFVLKGLD